MNKRLEIDDRLQVLQESEQEYYLTRVKDINSDSLEIYAPLSGGKTLDMPEHSSWQVCLVKDDAVYFFRTKVLEKTGGQDLVRYIIKRPESVKRHQRRGYVRVPFHRNILFWNWHEVKTNREINPEKVVRNSDLWKDPRWVSDYIAGIEEKSPGKAAFTLDMSGGGLRMVSLEQPEKQDRLFLKINLDEKNKQQVLFLEGRVVRVVPLNIGGWKRYRAGVSFINVDEKVRENLIGFLFKVMRNKM